MRTDASLSVTAGALALVVFASGCHFGENIHIHYHAGVSASAEQDAEKRIQAAFGGTGDVQETDNE